jgi:hypothetical protein
MRILRGPHYRQTAFEITKISSSKSTKSIDKALHHDQRPRAAGAPKTERRYMGNKEKLQASDSWPLVPKYVGMRNISVAIIIV